MIKTAVILAAGLGSRLKEMTKNKPKGFIEIDGLSLIERSIKKLLESGIEEIVIGTGYLSHVFDELSKKYSRIKCIKNNDYEKTGSMYTLYNLREHINNDFLLLESDLLYDKAGLSILINSNFDDVILASGQTNSHDEVFIETDINNNLINMSKDRKKLQSIYAELVGISKVSINTYREMCIFSEKYFNENPKLDYEYAMVGVREKCPFLVNKIDDYAWIEIDDSEHLKRAIDKIYPLIIEKEKLNSIKSIKRNVLLNPGPATTTDTVKFAQVVPDICPREKDFGRLMEFVSTELTGFVANTDEYISVLFGGSGTAGVEAVLSSVVGEKETILAINNGAYGERICQICKAYDYDLIDFKSPGDLPINLELVENTIKNAKKPILHLAVVHNETTTGLLNDIESIGKICNKYNINLIVDAMSSYAAVPINMKKMNINYLIASSNKNIQGMAGVVFVIAKISSLEQIKNIKPRNLYLNLYSQYDYFKKNYQMRFTPPVQTLYALKQAIIEAKEETLDARWKRYSKSWETLLNGLERLGLKYQVPKNAHGRIITSIFEPDCKGYNFDEMHDFLIEKGFTIYPGKVSNANCFRVANIGAIDYKDIEHFLVLLEEYLKKIGFLK